MVHFEKIPNDQILLLLLLRFSGLAQMNPRSGPTFVDEDATKAPMHTTSARGSPFLQSVVCGIVGGEKEDGSSFGWYSSGTHAFVCG